MTSSDYSEKINLCLDLNEKGKHSEARKLLKVIYNDRHSIVKNIDDTTSNKLAKCLTQAIKLEIPKNEDEEIDTALIIFYCTSNTIENSKDKPSVIEALRNRVILLYLYGELLIDSLISIIYTQETYPEEALMHQRKLCSELIKKMQLVDIYNIDDYYDDTTSDPIIDQICNSIETETCLNSEEISDAELMHRVVYTYIKSALKL
jgi:hypothetical protein